jgi:hypothetical protein
VVRYHWIGLDLYMNGIKLSYLSLVLTSKLLNYSPIPMVYLKSVLYAGRDPIHTTRNLANKGSTIHSDFVSITEEGSPEVFRLQLAGLFRVFLFNKHEAGSLKMNTALEYSTRVVQEGGRRCKKSTLNDLVHLTPLRIPLMNPPMLCQQKRRIPKLGVRPKSWEKV